MGPISEIAGSPGRDFRANDEVVDATEYRHLAEAMLASAKGDESRPTESAVAKCQHLAAYKRSKESGLRGLRDLVSVPFDCARTTLRFARTDGAVRTYPRRRIPGREPEQRSPSEGLGRRWAESVVVGDAKRSIYRFRGASAFNVQRSALTISGGARGRSPSTTDHPRDHGHFRSVRES